MDGLRSRCLQAKICYYSEVDCYNKLTNLSIDPVLLSINCPLINKSNG